MQMREKHEIPAPEILHIWSKIKKGQNRLPKLWSMGCDYIEKNSMALIYTHIYKEMHHNIMMQFTWQSKDLFKLKKMYYKFGEWLDHEFRFKDTWWLFFHLCQSFSLTLGENNTVILGVCFVSKGNNLLIRVRVFTKICFRFHWWSVTSDNTVKCSA